MRVLLAMIWGGLLYWFLPLRHQTPLLPAPAAAPTEPIWMTVADPDSDDEHLIPHNDTRDHLYDDCWCDPEIEDHGDHDYVVHNAADERELYEQGLRKPH